MNKTYDCMCTKLLVTVTHTLSWPGQQKLSSYNHYPMILGFLEGCLKCIGTRQDEGQKSLSFQFSSLSKLRQKTQASLGHAKALSKLQRWFPENRE